VHAHVFGGEVFSYGRAFEPGPVRALW
jgi:hypothetical protein